MNILLLGATGRTGKLILKELLAQDYSVNIIVRNQEKVKTKSTDLNVYEGSTLDKELLNKAITGCTAVISALNISRRSDFPWAALRTPKTLMSDTMNNIISVLHQHKIKRVVVISAWGVNETNKNIPFWFRWLINNSIIKYGYLDHERQEKLLAASDIDWTAIRAVGLIDSMADKPITVSLNNSPKPSLTISRNAVAKFAVKVLTKADFIGLAPVISW